MDKETGKNVININKDQLRLKETEKTEWKCDFEKKQKQMEQSEGTSSKKEPPAV